MIFERTTGEDLYAAFEDRIARPIGMEDYLPEDGFRVYEPSRSLHPAHTFRMSTRDLGRFGQLYLQRGEWGGRSVVPAEWVRESTRPHSDFGGGRGYGYMWWTYAAGSLGDDYPNIGRHDLYLARGTGGQAVFVIPDAELVVVHRGDTDNGREVPGPAIWTIVERLLAARVGDAVPAPRFVPLEPTPLESQAPPPPPLRFVDLDPRTVERYLGEYEIAPGTNIRVSLFEGRLFGFVPGEGDAELFALSRTEFTVKVIDGVRVVFEEDEAGDVTHLVLTMGDQVVRAHRLQ